MGGTSLIGLLVVAVIGFTSALLNGRTTQGRWFRWDKIFLVQWPFALWGALLLAFEFNRHGLMNERLIVYIAAVLGYFMGYMDDCKHIRNYYKLIFCFFVSGLVGMHYLPRLWVWPHGFLPPHAFNTLLVMQIILLLIGFVAMISMPLLDGINGLFIGFCAVLGLYSWELEALGFYNPGGCVYGNSLISMAAICAFFAFGMFPLNWPKAKLRLGEAAVWFLTMVLSVSILTQSIESLTNHSVDRSPPLMHVMPWGLLPLIYPIFDLILVSANRLRHGRSPFRAGQDHLHHRLIQSGFSPMKVTLMVLGAVGFAALTLLFLFRYLLLDALTIPAGLIDFENPASMKAGDDMRTHAIATQYQSWQWALVIASHLPLLYLFWRGYTNVNPYTSGEVNDRGRP